ncbi:MAG: hypothetical protein IKI11_08700 [Neisseriaceae bacterium]|nr:hypothetical protein [Neisseriaceae bacterium]
MKLYLTLLFPILCLAACGGSSESSADNLYQSNLTQEQKAVKNELEMAEKDLQQCMAKNIHQAMNGNQPVCVAESERFDKIFKKACEMGVLNPDCHAAPVD